MARGRKTSLTICLTADERQTLTAWQRSTTIPAGRATGRFLLDIAVRRAYGIDAKTDYKEAREFGTS